MLTNNYSFNSPGKQIQRETIVNDEKFINLINNLSELIKAKNFKILKKIILINMILMN